MKLDSAAYFFSRRLSRRERLRLYFSWPYIRQTRLLNPITDWWLNRGR